MWSIFYFCEGQRKPEKVQFFHFLTHSLRKNNFFSDMHRFCDISIKSLIIIFLYFFKLENQVTSLTELAAKCVASSIPFELVEHVFPPVPEQLQLRIAYWSFPDNEEDIRLYSCLANGSADEFYRGDQLYRNRSVKEPLQIGMDFFSYLKFCIVNAQLFLF